MTEQNRYLNAEEARQVREFVDHYDENAADADPVLDALDRSILKSECLSTIESVNSLLTTRALESQQKVEHSSVPTRVLQSIAADDAMADLDDAIFEGVRRNAPFSEDLGAAHLDAAYAEIETAQKVVKGQKERAAQERKETAARFMGFKYRTVGGSEFDRGKKR
jgi:hypothetical protein